MSADLYVAFAGASSAWRHVDAVANNMANSSTPGFRSARVSFGSVGAEGSFPTASGSGFETADGALRVDGVPTHLALRGDAMFVLEDGSYTRDGNLHVDPAGQLVTHEGVAVLGESGPIRVDPRESFVVAADGSVRGSLSGELGRLSLVRLTGATPLGGSRWGGTAEAATGAEVVQGAIEESNVDPMRCMAELIEAQRHFEAQEKLMRASDEMTSRLNRIGGS